MHLISFSVLDLVRSIINPFPLVRWCVIERASWSETDGAKRKERERKRERRRERERAREREKEREYRLLLFMGYNYRNKRRLHR